MSAQRNAGASTTGPVHKKRGWRSVVMVVCLGLSVGMSLPMGNTRERVGPCPTAQPETISPPIASRPPPSPPGDVNKAEAPPNEFTEKAIHIHQCSSPVMEVKAKEGKILTIASPLIADITHCKYGTTSNRQHDCSGLVDAYVHKGRLQLEVDPGVLGGNPGPKGENELTLRFKCGSSLDSDTKLTTTEQRFVDETLQLWKKEADNGFDNPCQYKTALKVPLPKECLDYQEGDQTIPSACYEKFYGAIDAYAAQHNTLPFNYHQVIQCMFTGLPKTNYPVTELRSFARVNHPVFLLRIAGRSIEWDTSGKPQSWKHELQGFSIFQSSVFVIEHALKADPSLSFDPPIYMLINALDEPRVGPAFENFVAPPEAGRALLREAHQAENIPSSEWIDSWTQWGVGNMFTPEKKPVPLLSWSTVPGWHRDIIVPNRHPGSCHSFFFDPKLSKVKFEEKADVVLFRAFSTACDHKGKGPRQRLVCYAEKKKGEITLHGQKVQLDIGGGRGWGPTGSQKFLSPAKQAKAKYILLVDGVVAAFRSTWLLQSGSVILSCGAWKDVRTQLLKPWIHYIPFSSDLHDFEAALSIVVKNQTYAKWVTENARQAGRLLSGHASDSGFTFDSQYFASVMQTYSKKITHRTGASIDSIPWSSDKKCKDWTQTTGRIRQCLPDTYACGNDSKLIQEAGVVGKGFFSGSG
eukprot:TRINITY_DN5607_c1_g2_i1.p1 TRINITY_DN5607_c1_g2~~TRINITY_DN5607_c1_g2_i1.p1  ORF type:complete len:693 (+),score=115.49 TRINITY_DN5607_c1_g2_i1:95-2173(+)